MAFGDVFAGWEKAAGEHYNNLLRMDYQNKRDLAAQYAKFAEDPKYAPEQQQEFARRAMQIPAMEPGKKLPKEWENMMIRVTAPAQQGPHVAQPGGVPQGSPGAPPMGNSAPNLAEAPDVQPPMPGPGMTQMDTRPLEQPMPFSEQMAHAQAESVAKSAGPYGIAGMRASIPKKIAQYNVQGPDGRRYPQMVFQYRDQNTGQMQQYEDRSDSPLPFFAPRNGPEVTVGEMKTAVGSGAYEDPWDQNGKPLDLNKLNDDEVIQHIGENRWILKSQKTELKNIGNVIYPYKALGGSIGAPVGPGPRTGTTTNYPVPTGINVNTGQPSYGVGTRVATPNVPGAYPGAPAQGPQAPPFPSNLAPSPRSGGPMAAPPPEAPVSPQTPAPPIAPPQGAGVRVPNDSINASVLNQEQPIMRAVTPAVRMLVGTPDNPFFEPLEAFGKLVDDPKARLRVGSAFRTILEGLANVENKAGPDAALGLLGTKISGGSISDIVKNFMGLPGLIARSEATAMEQAISQLSDQEKRMLARMFAAYGTVVGFRKFTSGGAYQFSTQAMEREIPIPGATGVNDSKSYYNKLSQLMEEPASAVDRMYSVKPEEKDFYKRAAVRLAIKGSYEKRAQDAKGENTVYLINGRWYNDKGEVQQ